MADITMCSGIGCPISHKCYRKNTKTDYRFQSFFIEPPYDKKKDICKMFWKYNVERRKKFENRRSYNR